MARSVGSRFKRVNSFAYTLPRSAVLIYDTLPWRVWASRRGTYYITWRESAENPWITMCQYDLAHARERLASDPLSSGPALAAVNRHHAARPIRLDRRLRENRKMRPA